MVHRVSFEFNWKEELSTFIDSFIERIGVKTEKDLRLDKKLILFFNQKLRRISKRKRNVVYSENFLCPESLLERVENIEKIIKKGEDLTPFLSKRILKNDYNDDLLNDWGIHHLHLGEEVQDDGFMQQRDELLFVKVTGETVYFLKVMGHKRWADQELLEIINYNWPELIEKFKLYGVDGVSEEVTESQRIKTRRRGGNALVQLKSGEVFSPMNGIVTSGYSISAVWKNQDLLNDLASVEKFHKENSIKLYKDMESEGLRPKDRLIFDLRIANGRFFMKERNSEYIVALFDHIDFKD